MNATVGQWIDGGDINIADVRISDGLHTSATDPDHTILDTRGLFVIHAVMLYTGKVLWFCGHVEDGHYALKSYLFDYKNRSAQLPSQDFPVHNSSFARTGPNVGNPNNPATGHFHADLFCCHFVHCADGKVLVVGGSDPDFSVPSPGTSHSSRGEDYIYLFDPASETWSVAQTGSTVSHLSEGRWYPTAVALGDGRVAVFSGRREFGHTAFHWPDLVSKKVDLLDPPGYAATALSGADKALPIYPGLHLAPNGRIYYTHTTWGLEFPTPTNTQSIEITSGATSASWTDHAGVHPTQSRREEGMSVLLPPANDGKIMVFGGSEAQTSAGLPYLPNGGNPAFNKIAAASDTTSSDILDTNGPTWTKGPKLLEPRINGHGVILPNRKVLIFGGHDKFKWLPSPQSNPSLRSELIDPSPPPPATGPTTEPMADLNHPRMYHAAAVLLPDGSVLVAGGADPNQQELTVHSGFTYPAGWQGPTMGAGTAYNRKDYEIYRPTYFFTSGTRPQIDSVKRNGATTTSADYGDDIVVNSPQAGSITHAGLMRPGAATHHTDSEQRYVELSFTRSGDDLTVTMPTNRNLAPPGYYMLWIVAGDDPCEEAKFIRLGSVETPTPTPTPGGGGGGAGGGWCIVVTAALGSPSAPEVVFLQTLRSEIRTATSLGDRFIKAVNALYYSVSPRIAKAMLRRPALRRAIREVMVKPSVALIRGAKELTGYSGGSRRSAGLIALLAALGISGLLLSPLLALLTGSVWLAEALSGKDDLNE